jgi:hypothetical protein
VGCRYHLPPTQQSKIDSPAGGTVVAIALLLIVAAFVGRKGYELAADYRRQITAVAERLPDLPEIRSGTRRRLTEFPVVWLHRVDSVERAVLMAHAYKGMEIDVVYDAAADYFDVGHHTVPSQGISLEAVFSSVPAVREHYFWIDFKNLTDDNKDAACARLLAIGWKYGIVDRMIVESVNPRALSCFSANGFYTSYYLFPDAKLSSMTREQLIQYYEEVKTNLMASKVNALSSSYRSLPFIERYFPDTDILLWYLEGTKGLRYRAWLTYLRTRSHVKVILVVNPVRATGETCPVGNRPSVTGLARPTPYLSCDLRAFFDRWRLPEVPERRGSAQSQQRWSSLEVQRRR